MIATVDRAAPRVHPYTRSLIRWRGEHLARTARLLQRAELEWEWTTLNRYDTYDGHTNDNPKPTPSPKTITIASHHRAWIPPAATPTGIIAMHTIDLTPAMLTDAIRAMRREGILDAWYRDYVQAPYPPVIYHSHPRDGVTPSEQTRYRRELRTAAAIWGILATEREVNVGLSPGELDGRA